MFFSDFFVIAIPRTFDVFCVLGQQWKCVFSRDSVGEYLPSVRGNDFLPYARFWTVCPF